MINTAVDFCLNGRKVYPSAPGQQASDTHCDPDPSQPTRSKL